MEPLWSPVVATGGNQRQIEATRKPRKNAKSVATDCDRLPETFHGKEGVDGSSPSEGFTKGQLMAFWCCLLARKMLNPRPRTCPQDLSPAARTRSSSGLNRRLEDHRVPPRSRGAQRCGSWQWLAR